MKLLARISQSIIAGVSVLVFVIWVAIVFGLLIAGGIATTMASVGQSQLVIHPLLIAGSFGLFVLMVTLHKATTNPTG